MNFPKKIMTITEIAQLGFSRRYLQDCVHIQGNTFALRRGSKGKFMIDTDEFNKFLGGEKEQ